MMRLRIIIAGLIFCLGLQELGTAFPAAFEQTIEYAKDGSEAKEEFVCESVKRVDLPNELPTAFPPVVSYSVSKANGTKRLTRNRILLFRSLRI